MCYGKNGCASPLKKKKIASKKSKRKIHIKRPSITR